MRITNVYSLLIAVALILTMSGCKGHSPTEVILTEDQGSHTESERQVELPCVEVGSGQVGRGCP